jgi:hypothetical protein
MPLRFWSKSQQGADQNDKTSSCRNQYPHFVPLHDGGAHCSAERLRPDRKRQQ